MLAWDFITDIYNIEMVSDVDYDLLKSTVLGETEVFLLLSNGKIIEVGKFQSEHLNDVIGILRQKIPKKEFGDNIKTVKN